MRLNRYLFSMKTENLKAIIEETIRQEVKKAILESSSPKEVYIIKNKEGEPIEICQSQEEAEEKKMGYEEKHPEQELIIEPGEEPSFDELDAMSEKLENMENIDENKKEHKGHLTSAQVMKLAKKAGEVVIDAQEDLEELCEMHGDKIPAQRVFDILEDYDMPELISKIKVKQTEPKEGNAFTGALAKAKEDGDDSFKVDGKEFDVEEEEEECHECGDSYMKEEDEEVEEGFKDFFKKKENKGKVLLPKGDKKLHFKIMDDETAKKPIYKKDDVETCEKCGKDICECGGMMESKRSVRLSESQLVSLISKMVNEAVPGLTVAQDAHKKSGEQNKEALSDVEKKIKSYLTFDGNDNPEFPGHNEGEVEARQNSEEDDEFVAFNRGGGLEDLDYDNEPSEMFKKRAEMSLKGDTKMGNSDKDVANVVPSKLGEKIIKKVKQKKEYEKEAPMYEKDAAPVKNVNEAEVENTQIISEEIKRMKEMVSYNKKTQ